MKKMFGLLAAASALSLALAVPAHAQAQRSINVGQTLSGALTADDPKAEDQSAYDDFSLRLNAGQSVEIVMSSSAFDSFLLLGKGTGSAFSSSASDDDSAGGQDARIRFTASEAGLYTVRANALNAGMLGPYSLRVAAYTAPPTPTATPITIGSTVSGTLADGGGRLEDGDKLYALYTFTAKKGDRIALSTAATAFDSMVELGRTVNGAFESIASDDDSGGDNNARLLQVLPDDGEYTVRVIGFDKDAKGDFTLKFEALPAPGPAPRAKAIRKGQVIRGELNDRSAQLDSFRPYDYYSIRGRAGETVTIIMRSEAFDAFLDVGAMTPGGFAVVASDDDGAGGTNAKVEFTFSSTGTVIIRTSALQGGRNGAFSLSVE
ncbi:MAG: pre-peptidase C-terminal domain-containing protein [Hyphomonadaceae bacterium]|nr:pre-peptidase C-terminal domain-containing protein [Hyphomonadaceae bacterium]